MSDRAPYSRIYWALVDDPKFLGIYDHDAHFATWVRLLMAADAVWPASANVPAGARKRSLEALVDAQLVDLQPGHRFRIRGLDAERHRRQTGPKRDLNGTQEGADSKVTDKTRRDESRPDKDETSRAVRADDPAEAYWQLTSRFPTEKTLTWLDDLTSKFGHQAVIRALATSYTEDRSTSTLLGRAQDHLRAEARELDRREREDEQRRLKEKRAQPRIEEPWRIEQRQAYLERYGPDAA